MDVAGEEGSNARGSGRIRFAITERSWATRSVTPANGGMEMMRLLKHHHPTPLCGRGSISGSTCPTG